MLIQSLTDISGFRLRRTRAWEDNIDYWLSQPLRHVEDVGLEIFERVSEICRSIDGRNSIVMDVGFGSGWLLNHVISSGLKVSYIGLDQSTVFVKRAKEVFKTFGDASFIVADVEDELPTLTQADLIVNAFNFFELSDLSQAMRNIRANLASGGKLLLATIDKTYLLMALSESRDELVENLRLYQNLPGVKYGFQRIDTGTHLSEVMEYPSVLYSTEDYIHAALAEGMQLTFYKEYAFTAKPIPKIYIFLEFELTCPPL